MAEGDQAQAVAALPMTAVLKRSLDAPVMTLARGEVIALWHYALMERDFDRVELSSAVLLQENDTEGPGPGGVG